VVPLIVNAKKAERRRAAYRKKWAKVHQRNHAKLMRGVYELVPPHPSTLFETRLRGDTPDATHGFRGPHKVQE